MPVLHALFDAAGQEMLAQGSISNGKQLNEGPWVYSRGLCLTFLVNFAAMQALLVDSTSGMPVPCKIFSQKDRQCLSACIECFVLLRGEKRFPA